METIEEDIKTVTMILHPDDIRVIKKGGTIKKRLTSIPDVVFEVCYKDLGIQRY